MIKVKNRKCLRYLVTVQPSVSRRRIYARIRIWRLVYRCDERPFMSKTVVTATISTQCVFTNGAG